MLRIVALMEETPGCNDVRLVAPLTALARRRWAAVTLCYLTGSRFRPWQAIEEADLVICQRLCLREHLSLLFWAQRHGKRTVYEIDDDLLSIPAEHPGARYRKPEVRAVIREAIESVDVVTTSTPALATVLKSYNPRVAVLENAFDPCAFGARRKGRRFGTPIRVVRTNSGRRIARRLKRRVRELRAATVAWARSLRLSSSRRVIVGYAGSATHQRDFDGASAALHRILEEFRGRVACRFIGFCPVELRGRPDVEVWPGSPRYRRYTARLRRARLDIAIAPLKADHFNLVKSDIKYLEYSACGYPTVAADIEPFRKSISSERGILVPPEDAESWYEALRQLIEAPEQRLLLGDAARRYVWNHRSVDAMLPQWMNVWGTAAGHQAGVQF